jgi:hypothetical protein
MPGRQENTGSIELMAHKKALISRDQGFFD